MKKFDRLAFYGWPALAIIILFSLFAGLLLLPNINKATPKPLSNLCKAAAVRYAATDNREPLSSEEMAEVRALYASDLFASSRGSRFSALYSATNHLNQTNIIPSVTPLFLPFTPASNEMNSRLSAINTPGADNDADDLPLFVHPPKQSSQQKHNNPKPSVELKGELKHLTLEPDFFQGISLSPPADRIPMFLQAQMRINREGRVDHVFAESMDCEPSIYQKIVKKLYQCHFSNVTQACEGTIIISYPAYSAEQPGKH